MKKALYILFLFLIILSGCTQNNASKNNIEQNKQELSNKIDFISLGNIGDDKFAKLIGFQNTFGKTFKKKGDLESLFSCTNNRCIKQQINFNKLGIYLILSIKTGEIHKDFIDKKGNNRFIINGGKHNTYELSKHNIADFSGFLKTGECRKKYRPIIFSEHGEFLQKGESKFGQNTGSYYTDILTNPYSGKMLMWYPLFGKSINNMLLHKKGFVYIKGINNTKGNTQQCFINKETNNSIIFSINPKSFYEIKAINNTTFPISDGLFSTPLSIETIK